MENTNQSISQLVAEKLLEIGAIKLSPQNPFKWASGWNSPIYCDNRLSLSFPEARRVVKESLVKECKRFFPNAEAIAGVATAGIPQGVLLAEALDLPFVYVRPKPKDHGLENLIEGKVVPGQKIVVLEDLVSTGGSSLKAVEELRKAGFEILGMLAIFTYGFTIADDAFSSAGVKLLTLTNYNSLIEIAVKKGIIESKDLESLNIWRESPQNWSVA